MMVQEQTTSERATTDPAGSRWRLAGVVLALLAAWLVMRVAFFEGFWGVDDLHHVRFALAMDHPPENHWETRLPVNALLWGSFQLFGFSDVSVALPSLLGSLLFLLSGVMMSWRLWRSPRMTAWVGLLLAVLPGDVLFSTTPGARIFATGLFCLAATLLMTRTGWASLVVSGVLFGLAIWSHLFVLFYVGIVLLCVAGFRLRPWRQAAAGLVLSVVMFAGPSMAIDAIWTGDPLHSFHVAKTSHLAGVTIDVHARHIHNDQGGVDPMFFVRPVKDLLFSKEANLLGLAAVVGGIVLAWRGRRGTGFQPVGGMGVPPMRLEGFQPSQTVDNGQNLPTGTSATGEDARGTHGLEAHATHGLEAHATRGRDAFATPEFGDALRCLSLDDGREIWRYVYPVVVKVNHGQSRTIPAVNDRYVVSLGPKCHVVCLDAVTGKLQWTKDLREQFGTTEPQWYAGQCPLIDGDRVILAPAGPDVLMMAVDLATGRVLWKTPNPMKWRMTHVSIIPMEFAGRRMFVYCGSGGMAGVSADEGRILWQTTEWKIAVATVPTPVVLPGGRLLCTGDYKAGSMMFQLEKSGGGSGEKITIRRLWRLPSEQFASRQHTPIYYDGYLYAVRPDGLLTCLDPEGRVVWTSGSDTFGLGPHLVSSQGLIYALDDDGLMVLAEATPQGYRPLARAKVLPGGECWAPLAMVDGFLIARDIRRMVCLDMREP